MSQEQMEIVNEAPQEAAVAAPGEANENEAQNQDASEEQGQDQGQGEPSAEQEPKIAKPVQSNVTFGHNLSLVYDLEVFICRWTQWGKLERRDLQSGCMGAVKGQMPCT